MLARHLALGALVALVGACGGGGGSSDLPVDDGAGGGSGATTGGGADEDAATAAGSDPSSGDDGGAPPATPDSGGADAGADCGGLAYCEGFEGYAGAIANGATVGPWTASVSATGATMTVDTQKAYRGTKSLHVVAANGTGPATHGTLAQKAAAGLVAGNDLFGRVMVYYANTGGAGLPIGVHSWLFVASGTSTALGANMGINMGGGGAKMQLNYSPTDQSVQGGTMTAGKWHCVQWQYDGSGNPPKDQAKVWVDGAVAVTIPASQGWKFATPWSAFQVGFMHYQTLSNAVDVYLDEFALDKAMVACPK